jgi:hypothetical protein
MPIAKSWIGFTISVDVTFVVTIIDCDNVWQLSHADVCPGNAPAVDTPTINIANIAIENSKLFIYFPPIKVYENPVGNKLKR